jgi:hypothetical protein
MDFGVTACAGATPFPTLFAPRAVYTWPSTSIPTIYGFLSVRSAITHKHVLQWLANPNMQQAQSTCLEAFYEAHLLTEVGSRIFRALTCSPKLCAFAYSKFAAKCARWASFLMSISSPNNRPSCSIRVCRWRASSVAVYLAVRTLALLFWSLIQPFTRSTAGGFDAVWLLVCEPPEDTPGIQPLARIERLWMGFPGVAPLLAQESKAQGIALERLDNVPGLEAAVASAVCD